MTRALQSDCVKITISKENYLKAIAEAESEGETVIAATLTRWLGVSAPAVTMAIKRLKRDGFIRVGKEGQITLTPEGHEIAERLLHRHHLIERTTPRASPCRVRAGCGPLGCAE